MQLTNIARDVGEDARNGRVYLPLDWLAEAGVAPDDVLSSPAVRPLVGRLLKEADTLYLHSLSGIAMLPAACRPSIHAARLLYAEIGREVERNGCDSVTRRAVVSTRRKLLGLGQALAACLASAPASAQPALPQAQFLVDAVALAGTPRLPPRTLDERAQWLTDLFTRLEKQRP
jgi:phytoene synthase